MARRRIDWHGDEIVGYVIDCYAGVELVETPSGVSKPARQFLWADDSGEVWIGNTAAFAEHLSERFGFESSQYDFVNVNRLLLDLGERIMDHQPRTARGSGKGSAVQEPRKERAK